MTVLGRPEPPLTDEQQEVVDLPADTLLLVTAGAGAGKTHTMVRRVARMLADDDLRPHEVLVLSFARSAVRELKDRLGRAGQDGRLVPVRTFDAFALELLMELDPGHEWVKYSFDDRIESAAVLVREGAAAGRLTDLRHLVVDEAQDLVGVRLELVTALLNGSDCSFTVVGDAAQSIYGFQIADPSERARSADACFRMLRSEFGSDLSERSLTRNFRARTDEARMALGFGPGLRAAAETTAVPDGAYEQLRTTLMGALLLGRLTDPQVLDDLSRGRGTTAILCRSNGRALIVAEQLAKGDVAHRVQRTAQDRVAPAWIAALFRSHPASVLSRAAFADVTGTLTLPSHHEADQVWRQLLRVAGDRSRRVVEMGRLRDAVAERRLPDELTGQPPADLVVSTFHRAKGLEFDRVVVMDPGPLWEGSDTPEAEEARLLYVAMTRPRDELFRLEAERFPKIGRDGRVDRYVRKGPQKWHRFGMEIGGEDVSSDRPAGTDGFDADACALQNRLASAMRAGDPVVLERMHDGTVDYGMGPPYLITHDRTPIGVTSVRFRKAMFKLLGGSKKREPPRYPARITEVRIDAVEAVAGSPASGSVAGLGEHGIWLAPRLVGLGSFNWRGEDA